MPRSTETHPAPIDLWGRCAGEACMRFGTQVENSVCSEITDPASIDLPGRCAGDNESRPRTHGGNYAFPGLGVRVLAPRRSAPQLDPPLARESSAYLTVRGHSTCTHPLGVLACCALAHIGPAPDVRNAQLNCGLCSSGHGGAWGSMCVTEMWRGRICAAWRSTRKLPHGPCEHSNPRTGLGPCGVVTQVAAL